MGIGRRESLKQPGSGTQQNPKAGSDWVRPSKGSKLRELAQYLYEDIVIFEKETELSVRPISCLPAFFLNNANL